MWYIEQDIKKGIEENYIPDWLDDIKETVFTPEIIPWVNNPQLQADISIEGNISWIDNLQDQIDDLDVRVTALENP